VVKLKALIRNLFLPKVMTGVLLLCLATAIVGTWAIGAMPLDAIPDVSDRQVIVYAQWNGQDPQVIEDQVTYPITTTLQHVAHVRSVRSYTGFGFAMIYVLLDDGVDPYWARSRALEYLDQIRSSLPADPTLSVGLGPDATGVGWVYEYALRSKNETAEKLRSLQDWFIRYALQSVPGVSEVAAVGGSVREYQIRLDPNKLRAFDIPLTQVVDLVRSNNSEQGGRWIETAGQEVLIRGLGYIQNEADLAKIVLKTDAKAVPVTIGDVGRVVIGMAARRGAADLDGDSQVVGGVVVARMGADVASVVAGVKAKLEVVKKSLPADVEIIPVYDRSEFINASLHGLRKSLVGEAIVVVLVVLIFLRSLRSALIILVPLPIALLATAALLKTFGTTTNIMALSGIAIAVGTMVDAAIVLVENAYRHLQLPPATGVSRSEHRSKAIFASLAEVTKPVLISTAVIAFSFLPVLLLSGEEGRLFRPLVLAKTFAVASEFVLIALLLPILLLLFMRPSSGGEPRVASAFAKAYNHILDAGFRYPGLFIVLVGLAGVGALALFLRMGGEFLPPIYEGDLMYMPTTFPSASITEMEQIMAAQDKALKRFPEVERVFGKVGRADTATDPAPLSMIETIVKLKPMSEWRAGMTREKLIEQMDAAVKTPGVINAWTMPIRGRIDMLSTGLKSALGIKVYGRDFKSIDGAAEEIARILKTLPGARNVYAERTNRGEYFDVDIDRDALQRYGLSVSDVQDTLRYGIGGARVATSVEGLERYPIAVRYDAETRSTREQLLHDAVVYSKPFGFIPLGYVVKIVRTQHPTEIKTENGMYVDYVYIDLSTSDLAGFRRSGAAALDRSLKLPAGVFYEWSGQAEGLDRAWQASLYIPPLVLLIIIAMYYSLYASWRRVVIVVSSVPFSLIGSVVMLHALGYQMSVAVVIGMLALVGVSAQTAVVMLTYIDLSVEAAERERRLQNREQFRAAIYDGAVKRLRPKLMTVFTVIISLIPVMLANGIGAEVAKRVAAPMIGGMISSAILVLFVVPLLYFWTDRRSATLGGAS
jgi:copper/silver efflux system protein